MFILMHCGGMPFNGTTVDEKSLGGSESAAYYTAKELAAQGHKVTMFTAHEEGGESDGVRYEYHGSITERAPLGENYHYYATYTPHDVNITQRHPQAFAFNWASKVNLWWLHDLALKRSRQTALSHMWNIDGILTVSEYHKQQIVDVWGLNPEIVHPITNGVDLSLFDGDIGSNRVSADKLLDGPSHERIALLYSSRPERGLEAHVMPGGVMELLAEKDPRYHLYVCAYANVTDTTRDFYAYLDKRCEILPNVTNLGHLTKQELASVMRSVDAMVYPAGFEEVSCITAMECMAAGLPFFSSKHAALPETCTVNVDAGVVLIPTLSDDSPNAYGMAHNVHEAFEKDRDLVEMRIKQLDAAPYYTWERTASSVESIIRGIFFKIQTSGSTARHFMRHSDITPLRARSAKQDNAIAAAVMEELAECYDFTDEMHDHYEKFFAAEDKNLDEKVEGTPRFETVAAKLEGLPNGSRILDYGCGHGHYTTALARRYPEYVFTGVDISETNIKAANESAEVNAAFYAASNWHGGEFDAIVAAEIMEHVDEPVDFIDELLGNLKEGGLMVITTPYGRWESMSYENRWPWREHLHHFERADLADMFGGFPDYAVTNVPAPNPGDALGSYVSTFTNDMDVVVGEIEYFRKMTYTAPRQTVSLCMIVKDAADDIARCIRSALPIVDEVILYVDQTTTDGTVSAALTLLEGYKTIPIRVMHGESPTEIGFDEARNRSIADASGDWILWLDSDEVLKIRDIDFFQLLRHNQFNAYAVKQHHFSMEPVGVMKTDMPARLFRNNIGIKFYGVVHEHPEMTMNEGCGHTQLISSIEIAHYGYKDEGVRRGRFQRNIDLMKRDRKKYPERKLGRFLWVRDLAQMSQYRIEAMGGKVDKETRGMAKECIDMWRSLLDDGEFRLTTDALPFYTEAVGILGTGIECGIMFVASEIPGVLEGANPDTHMAIFATAEDVKGYSDLLISSQLEGFGGPYL